MIARYLTSSLLAALADTPVVLLNGARQTGKSTLARHLAETDHPARYLTLDDAAVLAAARQSPADFLRSFDGPVVLDEVQRAPELFVAIKHLVDRHPGPGRFLLTGSADVLLLPQLSESLAGRMEILTLWPLSQAEIAGARENFLDAVFLRARPVWRPGGESRSRLIRRLVTGGYPPLLRRSAELRRAAWFGSYILTILQRDVRDWANIEGLTALPRLLSLLASRAGCLLNFADLSNSIAIPQTTLKRYMTLLEMTFLVQLLPAWEKNLGKRLVKSPKLTLNDTGLMASLQGLDPKRLALGPALGPLLENFVVMELRKLAGWSKVRPSLYHFRSHAGQEVDVVLETPNGDLVGVEVKASSTVSNSDFKGLRVLAEFTGRRFRRGVLLYTGAEPLSFGANLLALPVDALWQAGRSERG